MNLVRRLRALFRRKKLDAEMAEEMRQHLELRTQANLAAGMSPDEARYAAQRQFGGVDQIKEIAREQRGVLWLEQTLRDIRYAGRQFAKSPGFTLTAVVTLAVGIGLNTSMFSLANALMLRPLPFRQADQLVRLQRTTPQNARGGFAAPDYFELRRDGVGFGRFAAFTQASVTLAEPGQPAAPHQLLRVSVDFLEVLEIRPLLGRTFRPEEETSGNHRVVLLSHALWESRFGGARDVLGRTVRIDAEPHEIIGVLPAWATERRPFAEIELIRPLGFTAGDRAARDRFWLSIVGRRADTVSADQGNALVAAVGARIAKDFPAENSRSTWRSQDLLSSTMNPTGRRMVFMLLGLSGCVLLIACANLANLLLVRTLARGRELAVRSALGASRAQLFQPLAFESLTLAGAGGVGALFVATWTSDWLSAQSGLEGGRPLELPLDWRVLGFALGASVLTALIFGLAPALFTTRIDVNDALKRGGRGASASRGQKRVQHCLIVGQFAMAMVLVAGAGFFLRGADNVLKQEYGWSPDDVVQGTISLPASSYPTTEHVVNFHRQVLERLRALPGVESVSLSHGLPYFNLPGPRPYLADGREAPPPGSEPSARFNGLTPEYFQVTGTRLLRGRVFNEADTASSPKVVIVSESMARLFFPNEEPLGRRIAPASGSGAGAAPAWAEIVGIVTDVRSMDIAAKVSTLQVYHPLAQEMRQSVSLAVRAGSGAPASLLESIRVVVTAQDPDLPVRDLRPVRAMLARTLADFAMINKLLGGFALLGLFLAALGVYGVIARTVEQRTGELGIRMALGAQVADVVRLVLGSGVRLALIGAAIGLIGAFALSRGLASGMPGMKTDGNLVLVAASATLALIALLACYLPARKAARVNPLVALRAE